MDLKIYVAVKVIVFEDGSIKPLSVIFDGREYVIDRVTRVCTAPPRSVGGLITKRYDCIISGRERSIYVEATGRWFVEKKNPLQKA